MSKTVYIETTVPSAYFSTRRDPRSLVRRQETRAWWQMQRTHFDCFISREVLDELAIGEFAGQRDALGLVAGFPRLEINEEVMGISEVYVEKLVMPGPGDAGDSLHLACAAYHEVDYLLTWNIRHLANPNKMEHLTIVNRRLGLLMPLILTPDMLWWEED